MDCEWQHKEVSTTHRRALIRILQMAYSGEKSAALAYQGHAASVKNKLQKERIQQIEAEEWHHRERVLEMLHNLGSKPSPVRERMQVMIGRTLKTLCPVTGWLLPMVGAWLLEENNIMEYAQAAQHATALDFKAMAEELTHMSTVERDHAVYFKTLVLTSPWKLMEWG